MPVLESDLERLLDHARKQLKKLRAEGAPNEKLERAKGKVDAYAYALRLAR